MIGQKIGKYELREKRGEGGFGVLYRAFDTVIEREIALKLLHRQFATDERFSAWFHREAKAMAKLNHPNIVTIYNFEIVGDDHFIAMEYVDGKNVDEILRQQGVFRISEIIAIARQLLSALGYAHTNGIIHRDIKPSNIMLTSSGLVKITDFGIAKILGSSKLTQTGTGAGSLPYMSPEQIRGKAIDARTDIYSVGVTLYQMATGALPFQEESDFLLMQAHLEKKPPKPSDKRSEVPSGLDDILLKALEKDADQRFSTAADMIQALLDLSRAEGIGSESDQTAIVSQVYEKQTAIKEQKARSESAGTEILQKKQAGIRPTTLIIGLFVFLAVMVGVYLVFIKPPRPEIKSEPVQEKKIIPTDTQAIAAKDSSKAVLPAVRKPDSAPTLPVKYDGKLEVYYAPFEPDNPAEIYLSGRKLPQIKNPIHLDTLKPGTYTILLAWQGVRFFDTVMVGSEPKTREFNFKGPQGKVRISASFIGDSPDQWGEVYVDEVKQESGTPCVIKLVEGPHKILVAKKGFVAIDDYKIANVVGDADIELNFKMRRK